jgi:hypothetical protein
MRLPTADEISVYGTLDEACAVEHFLGKTLEEAEALFRENSSCYLEDLMWMGPRAFCFYVPAAINYLRSSAGAGDSDGVNAFLTVVEFRLSDEGEDITASLPDLRAAVGDILDHWASFDVDPAIYGDLRERYTTLAKQLDG